MTVVYLDSVFLFNALLDYLLFLSTARLAGIPLRRPALPPLRSAGRAVCCGGVPSRRGLSHGNAGKGRRGAAAGAHRLWPGDPFSPADAADRRHRLRLGGDGSGPRTVGGAAHSQRPGNFLYECHGKTLLLSASGVYLLLTVIFRAAAAHGDPGECLPVTVWPAGANGGPHRIAGHGQQPAGHRRGTGADGGAVPVSRSLRRPIQHRPPAETLPMLRQRFPKLRPQLLPMRTAAGGGLLVSVSSDWTEIGGVRYPNLRIALTDTELGGGYTALWGGEGRRNHERMAAAAAVPSGIVPGAGAALYRRQ